MKNLTKNGQKKKRPKTAGKARGGVPKPQQSNVHKQYSNGYNMNALQYD